MPYRNWTKAVFVGLVLVFGLYCCVLAENIDVDLSVDRTNWIDPTDPLSMPTYCSKSATDQLVICKDALNSCLEHHACAGNVKKSNEEHSSIFKLLVRNIITRSGIDPEKKNRVHRTVEVYLSRDDVATIQHFLTTDHVSLSQREQVQEIMENFIVQDTQVEYSYLQEFAEFTRPFLPVFNLVLAIPCILTIFRNHIPVRSAISSVFLVAFFISMYTTWNRKYEEILAARMSRSVQPSDQRCKPEDFFSVAKGYVMGFLFIREKNECLQYFEDLNINIFHEISILDVICDVLANFIFTPLGIFGRHFSAFFNEFYRDSPLHLVIIKLFTFVLLIASLLIWLGLRTVFLNSQRTDWPRVPIGRTYDNTAYLGRHAATKLLERKSAGKDTMCTRRRSLSLGRLHD